MPETVLVALLSGIAAAVFTLIGSVITMIVQSREAGANRAQELAVKDKELSNQLERDRNTARDAGIARLRGDCSSLLDAVLLARRVTITPELDTLDEQEKGRWYAEQAGTLQNAVQGLSKAMALLGAEPEADDLVRQADEFSKTCLTLSYLFDLSAKNPGGVPQQDIDDSKGRIMSEFDGLRETVISALKRAARSDSASTSTT